MPESIKSGFLYKRRNKFPQTWQKRWFVINPVNDGDYFEMAYFKSEEDASNETTTPQGVIDLEQLSVFEMKDGLMCFDAYQTNKDREKQWCFKADDEEELKAWAKAIHDCRDETFKILDLPKDT